MKIIIFIIIACTLFVAWSLCVVGASADEQLEMIYAKDLERKENSMDNTYAPTENKEQEKIKVESIDTIVTMHGDKPYYENKYREVGDKCYHIGYSSYCLDVALEYRKKYFEVVERKSDWILCSEQFPEERDSIFAKWKDTNKWTSLMFEKNSDTVIVTVKYNNGEKRVAPAHTIDGKWKCDALLRNDGEIIAWMPLPEPYREEQ